MNVIPFKKPHPENNKTRGNASGEQQDTDSSSSNSSGRAEKRQLREIVERYAYVSALDRYVYRANPLNNQLTSKAFAREIAAEYKLPKKGRRTTEWVPTIKKVDAAGIVSATALGFHPGKPAVFKSEFGQTILNTYQVPMWAATARQRETAEEPHLFTDHIAYLCNGDLKVAGHILDWMAHLVQRPWEKPVHAILITSPAQGVGKSTVREVLEHLVGTNQAKLVTPGDIKGTFSDWLIGQMVVVVDEVYEGGNWGLVNSLKYLISETRASVNAKNRPIVVAPNYARFLMFSNHSAPLALEEADRRYLVVRCEQEPKGETYHSELRAFIRSDEGMQAIYDFLVARDISAFKPFAPPPMTFAKRDIIRESENPVTRFLHEKMPDSTFWEKLPPDFTLADVQKYLSEERQGHLARNAGLVRDGLKEAGFMGHRKMREGFRAMRYDHEERPTQGLFGGGGGDF